MGAHIILDIHTVCTMDTSHIQRNMMQAELQPRALHFAPPLPLPVLPLLSHCCIFIAKTMLNLMLVSERDLHQHKQGSGLLWRWSELCFHFIVKKTNFASVYRDFSARLVVFWPGLFCSNNCRTAKEPEHLALCLQKWKRKIQMHAHGFGFSNLA